MADVFTKAKRSAVMSRIRGAGNKDTELRLIVLMRAAGIAGWRRGAKLRFVDMRRSSLASRSEAGEARRGPVGPQRGWRRGVKLRFTARGQKLDVGNGKRSQSGSSALSAFSAVKPGFVTIRPDFVFRKHRLAVFVDGCFWHGCPQHATWPKNNAAFWRKKIQGNIARDRAQDRLLRAHGWRALRVWEHALTWKYASRTVARLQRGLSAKSRLTA